jgi:hypothetical protein
MAPVIPPLPPQEKEAGDLVEKALEGAGERTVALESGGEVGEERCDGAGELAAAVEACHEGSSALHHRLALQAAHDRADVATETRALEARQERGEGLEKLARASEAVLEGGERFRGTAFGLETAEDG